MKINLKNSMIGDNYSFPKSIVKYKIENDTDNVSVLYKNNKIPCQVSKGLLCFETELKSGETREFKVVNERITGFDKICSIENEKIILENDNLKIVIDDNLIDLVAIIKENIRGYIRTNSRIVRKEIGIIENGAVFASVKIDCYFENEDKYSLLVTLERSKEYFIIDEIMDFDNSYEMYIEWENVEPEYRITESNVRKSFIADEYTNINGKIPQRILPHDQTNGFANTIYAAFYGSKYAVGVFIGDINRWNDGSYAIEGNNYINAIEAYCKIDDGILKFAYPLNRGTRQTCVAVFEADKPYMTGSYIKDLYYFNSLLTLDEYKSWDLEWENDKTEYPVFFNKDIVDSNQKYDFLEWEKGVPPTKYFLEKIKENDMYKEPWKIGPVISRAYGVWSALFDITASDMTDDEFDQIKRILLFGAYYCSRECFMPTKTTLAGHPNFLIDTMTIVGICSALFKEHPMALYWKEYYEKCVALVLKFHIRPKVDEWKSKGGRPTENQGTYVFGCLNHMFMASFMIAKAYGDNPALHENIKLLSDWILNIVTSPINGKRTIPYTGAHAGGHYLNPYYLLYHTRLLGYMMMDYEPILGEYLLGICPKEPAFGHETVFFGGRDIWDFNVYDNKYADYEGLQPPLKSSKYTGYGYNLRANVGDEDEMFVLLQQIDEGQNYRWGRAGQGGCGTIHYFADGKVYSGIRKEDIGDDNFRDSDVGCNFCVLINQTYKSVGMNDLTEPLIDFGTVQYARVNAGKYSNDEYKYRSVMMVDNSYIVVLDAVRDIRTQGRFSWFNYTDEEMPQIYQLKPGVAPFYKDAPQFTVDEKPINKAFANHREVRGVSYNGFGDFLTVVTHKKDVFAEATSYGALVNKTDYIFNAEYTLKYNENDIEFFGKVGFARRTDNGFDIAVINGKYIACDGTRITVIEGKGCVSIFKQKDIYTIRVEAKDEIKVTIDGDFADYKLFTSDDAIVNFENITLKSGNYIITKNMPKPEKLDIISYTEEKDGVSVDFEKSRYANSYEVEIDNQIKPYCDKLVLDGGRHIIRIRAINADFTGDWSNEYPIYVTHLIPTRVEGLRVKAVKDTFKIAWGKKYGVKYYKLYRDDECIYEGKNNRFTDVISGEHKYYVTAVNGYGESEKSILRTTEACGLAYYDPMPEIKYLRDTIVNHHGYGGFDYKYNELRKRYIYPD